MTTERMMQILSDAYDDKRTVVEIMIDIYNLGRTEAIDEYEFKLIHHLADWQLAESPHEWDSKADKDEANLICGTIGCCCKAAAELAEQMKRSDQE